MMWSAIELRDIRVFLTLVTELHFGRAGERLGISHARVSQTISTLETRIGGRLFERSSRRVRLTPLGEQLYGRLAPAYEALQLALAATADEAASATCVLRIGFTMTSEGPTLSRVIRAFRDRHPTCQVILHEADILDPYQALRRGETDVLCHYRPINQPDLAVGPELARYPVRLAMPRGHRLAGRDSVSVEDLADEEVARVPATFPAELHDMFLPPTTRSGRPIRRTYAVKTFKEIVPLIAQGRIVFPIGPSTVGADREDIVTVPIRDVPPLVLTLIWRARRDDPRVRALAEVAAGLAPISGDPV
jgi:DNA-binding transcriptional LysR family regulator